MICVMLFDKELNNLNKKYIVPQLSLKDNKLDFEFKFCLS